MEKYGSVSPFHETGPKCEQTSHKEAERYSVILNTLLPLERRDRVRYHILHSSVCICRKKRVSCVAFFLKSECIVYSVLPVLNTFSSFTGI